MSESIAVDVSFPELQGPLERRKRTRFHCALRGECQPIGAMEAGNSWPARAADISRSGVNLRLSRRFEAGTFLAIHFSGQPADDVMMPLARVCHVVADGMHWRIGCVWARELSKEDLRTLVGKLEKRAA